MDITYADSRSVWETVQRLITPTENAKFLAALGYSAYEALVTGITEESTRENDVFTALTNSFQEPVELIKNIGN